VRIGCAKCHHHPFEKWSQDDYYSLAAYFARVGLKGSQEFGIFGGEQRRPAAAPFDRGHVPRRLVLRAEDPVRTSRAG